MSATIELLEVATGDIRHIPAGDTTPELLEFRWVEGSHSCDCNREVEWHRAHGLTSPFKGEPCTTGRYLVRITCDGDVILDEHPPQPKETDMKPTEQQMTDFVEHMRAAGQQRVAAERIAQLEARVAQALVAIGIMRTEMCPSFDHLDELEKTLKGDQ